MTSVTHHFTSLEALRSWLLDGEQRQSTLEEDDIALFVGDRPVEPGWGCGPHVGGRSAGCADPVVYYIGDHKTPSDAICIDCGDSLVRVAPPQNVEWRGGVGPGPTWFTVGGDETKLAAWWRVFMLAEGRR